MKIALLILLANSFALAFDSSKCSTILNKGLYKKYKWNGIGEANNKAMTAETKSSGSTKGTTRITSENTTAVVDPKYTTNVTVTGAQGTSSWGPCSAFGMLERRDQRDLYVAQNFDQIKKDIASGNGEHLKTLAWFALCEDHASDTYFQTLQSNFEKLSTSNEAHFTKTMDQVVESNSALKSQCFNLTAI